MRHLIIRMGFFLLAISVIHLLSFFNMAVNHWWGRPFDSYGDALSNMLAALFASFVTSYFYDEWQRAK